MLDQKPVSPPWERVLELLLGRPLAIDPKVSAHYVLCRSVECAVALARGLLFVRKKILVGHGTRITGKRYLRLSGGLTRIDEYCLIDCLSTEGVFLGRNFKLGAHSRIVASGTIRNIGTGVRIGDNVGIGEFAYIGGAGGVTIGDGTIAGQYFSVHPENHIFGDPDLPIKDQGVTRKGIEIGKGCWIGAKVTICDGVKIGRNSMIAAGSVVTKSFPDNSLIGGVPARLIRNLRGTSSRMAD